MQITYVGPFEDGVVVITKTGEVVVAKGASYDFPAELAQSLLEQADNWKPTPKRAADNEKKEK